MLSCWKDVPNERPTFSEITKILQDFPNSKDDVNNFNLIVDDKR